MFAARDVPMGVEEVSRHTLHRGRTIRFAASGGGDAKTSTNAGGSTNQSGKLQNASSVLARAGKAFGKLGYFSFW